MTTWSDIEACMQELALVSIKPPLTTLVAITQKRASDLLQVCLAGNSERDLGALIDCVLPYFGGGSSTSARRPWRPWQRRWIRRSRWRSSQTWS